MGGVRQLALTGLAARRGGSVDVMSRELVTVGFSTLAARGLSIAARTSYQGVGCGVNCSFRIAGTVALADVVRAAGLNVCDGLDDKRHQFTRFTSNVCSGKPAVVGQTMTRNVRVAGMQRPLVELLALFGSTLDTITFPSLTTASAC